MGFFDKFFGKKEIEQNNPADADVFNEEDLALDDEFYLDAEAWGGVKVAKQSRG